jgi:nitrite reductase/ring-hydroxylating ferredoxin subunit
MDFKKRNWVRVALSVAELDIEEKTVIEADADGKIICIGQYNGELFAFAQKCPHAGAPFKGGPIDHAGNVLCPRHRYKFCMKNGRNVSGEGYYLKHWPVEVRGEGVFVGLDVSGWSLF